MLGAHKKQRGFTLIELIAVIIILSVVAAMGSSFVVQTQQAYHQTQARAKLINKSRQAIERMTRQLRAAVPYSWRLTNSNNCVEFLPIAGGGNYLNPVPTPDNGIAPSAATDVIATAPHTQDFGAASALNWVVIGAMASGEIYGGNSSAPLASDSALSVSVSGSHQWLRNSINQRFYLADNPQAFCLVGTELRFYSDQTITDSAVDLSDAHQVLALGVSGATPFVISGGSESRNVILTLNFTFTERLEGVTFTQEVSLRNVP